MELVDKNFKMVIINMFKDLKENKNIMREQGILIQKWKYFIKVGSFGIEKYLKGRFFIGWN